MFSASDIKLKNKISTSYYATPGDNSEEAVLGSAHGVSISVICNSRPL